MGRSFSFHSSAKEPRKSFFCPHLPLHNKTRLVSPFSPHPSFTRHPFADFRPPLLQPYTHFDLVDSTLFHSILESLTMELPSIGKHCSDPTCSQLDFLPFTCQHCKQTFCQDHWRLEGHACPNSQDASLKDQRVPICPLCDKPVPVKKGEDPNLRMEQHISAGCPEPATTISKPIYTNSCNVKGCKNRSAIPIVCQNCRLNYCLKHRLESDHACTARSSSPGINNKGRPNGNSSNNSNGNSNNNSGNGAANKAVNVARNARASAAAAAAQLRAHANANGHGRHGNSSGKTEKDKCSIS